MKKKISALLLLPALCLSAPSPVLTLTEINQDVITGKIISFSPKTGSVKIHTGNAISPRRLSDFAPDSQKKIALWLADKNFLTKSKLSADFYATHTSTSSNIVGTITDSRTKTEREGTIGTKKTSLCTYKISLTNKSNTPFENLTIDYRIFHTQRITKDFTGKYQLAGRVELDALSAGSTWSFETNPFIDSILYRSAPRIRWGGQPPSFTAGIQGIQLCVRKTDVTGEWIEQEIVYGEIPPRRERKDYQKLYK